MDLPPGLQPSGPPAWSPAPTNVAAKNAERVIEPRVIQLTEENPALEVTELGFLVPDFPQNHADLISSSKNRMVCFANASQLQVWESAEVRTIAKLSGTIVDVSFSPHFETFVAAVTDAGEAIVHDTKLNRPTVRVVPARNEAAHSFLKVCWHPSVATVLATAYQDGLICVWDLFVATSNPQSVVNSVVTVERPKDLGIVYPNTPTLLVTMRVPEPLADMTMVGEYVLTTSVTGTIRIYDQKTGTLLSQLEHVEASRLVVVSEVPFVFVACCGPLNQDVKVFRLATASPLKFELVDVFQFASFPQGHIAAQVPFRLLRISSKGMIVLYHPMLCAMWVIAVTSGHVLTYGSRVPFDCLSTHDPSQGFVSISNSSAELVQFSNAGPDVKPEMVPLVPPSLLAAHQQEEHARFPSGETPSSAQVDPISQDTLELLRAAIEMQNEMFLKSLSEQRELTNRIQAHLLSSLAKLPDAILEAVSPTLDSFQQAQKSQNDASSISKEVADSVREPAAAAMNSYFKEALIPGFQRACSSMTADISTVLDESSQAYTQQLLPIHSREVIYPLVNGLSEASERVTAIYKGTQARINHQKQPSTSSTHTSPASPSPSQSTSNTSITASGAASGTATTSTSAASSSSSHAPPVASSSASTTSSSVATSTSATNEAPSTPAKKKKSVSVSSPANTSAATNVASNAPTSVATTTSTSTSAVAAPAKKKAESSNQPAPVTPPEDTEEIETEAEVPAEPRPEPKATTPVTEVTRHAIMSHVMKKQWTEAVDLALASETVEALGFLTSRADMSQWIDTLSEERLENVLLMILAQTPWPSPSQLQKYSNTMQLVLFKLDPTNLSSKMTSAVLNEAKDWTAGTPIESSVHPLIATLISHASS